MTNLHLHLLHHQSDHFLVKVPVGTEVNWSRGSSVLFSVTSTATETSVICAGDAIPEGFSTERPLHVFEVAGPLSFSMFGVLDGLLTPLANHGIAIAALSTYDTEWLLVESGRAEEVEKLWRRAGYLVTPPRLGA